SDLWPDRLWHRLHGNSRGQAARNIAFHYDLGNDFYAHWLDAGMTYSSALFASDDEPLELAQRRKYARLAELAGIAPGDRVLEIGCGWGGFMEFAAGECDADVTGISISPAQCGYARERLARAGLGERARVEQRDYRDLTGRYPRIVSIEMFEAVGEAYWSTYARQLAARLAPGGAAALQIITIAEDRFEQYRRNPDFIQRYVFPGGMLPSEPALARTLADAGLVITARHACALDYARTLAHWRDRFDASWPAISALGFDARFRRLWHFYLAYCEAGFRSDATDVVQLRVEHVR
ncbi:MAG: cyclopropane-fatty-acyl-phospholipid synthase family protein, partial [Gammaproteobacteria bacterium]